MSDSAKVKFSDKEQLLLLFSVAALLIVLPLLQPYFSTSFSDESTFYVSQATQKEVYVPGRINAFYSLLGIGVGVLLLVYFGLKKLFWKKFDQFQYISFFKWLLLFQIILSVTSFFRESIGDATRITEASIVLLLLVEIFRKRLKQELSETAIKSHFLVLLAVFFVSNNIYISSVAVVAWILVSMYTNQVVIKWVRGIVIAAPMLLVLSVETTLIFNQNGMHIPYLISGLIFMLLYISFLRWKKYLVRTDSDTLEKIDVPILLLGGLMLMFYVPIVEQEMEMFELANGLNPVMMMSSHNLYPFKDYITSHLTSDFFFPSLYSLLNGATSDSSPMIYYGGNQVLGWLAIFWFLKQVFKDSFAAMIAVLFFPVITFILPLNFALLLLPAGFLLKYDISGKAKYLMYFSGVIILLLFWKLDVGIAAVGGALVLFVARITLDSVRRKILIRVTLICGVFGAIVLGTYLMLNYDLLHQSMLYFGASQAHGLELLTREKSTLFYIDYYLLPILIGIVFVVLILLRERLSYNYWFWMLIFLIGVYFFNVQRGLVRHSFMERNEYCITSTGWLVLILFVSMILREKLVSLRMLATLTVLSIVFSIHSISRARPVFDIDKMKIDNLPDVSKGRVLRATKNIDFDTKVMPLVNFFKRNLKEDETFVDLSNSPMLYYYSQKRVPSVFSQYLQNTVDEELQLMNIELLNSLKLPYVVFSQHPESYYDNTDGIPNEVRYFQTVKFIYSNFKPWKQIGKYHIWKKKADFEPEIAVNPDFWKLEAIPYYWGKQKTKKARKVSVVVEENEVLLSMVDPGTMLELEILSTEDESALVVNENQTFKTKFTIKKGKHIYRIPVSSSYHLIKNDDRLILNSPTCRIVSARTYSY